MRGKSDGAGETDVGTEGRVKRIDLSVPQVAGSALAAVVAAKLASSFGVYGTILGAGLISVVATCGGSVFQHFFKRTGEQIRVKRTTGTARPAGASAAAATSGAVRAAAPGPPGVFTEGTVYRARTTGRRRPIIAAALVFGVTMTGITTYELASGQNLSGGHSTTVGSAFSGHGKSAADSGGSGGSGDSGGSGESESPGDDQSPDGSGDAGDGGAGGSDAPASTPSGTPDASQGGTAPDGGSAEQDGTASSAAPTPDATGDEESDGAPDPSATAPEPGASSRSGTGDQGQDGPAAR
ncbi:hypothetical protein [Streptomyces olivaceus]|uniref:hypothetical protein n=1 Tax=Streptomyces olivaceus TaxID=47716 RepID=UPI0022EFD0A5|nr:hypothetical protein [Streptomyces olivaceus]GHI94466.1 hypothetical protein TPA0905_39370 [Streptomyces olivaceus]